MFVWSDLYLRGIAPSELEIPPIGTTYRVTDRPNGVEPLDLTTNQSCASGVGSSTPSQSVEVIGCRPRLGPSGWILPKMPVRYLTFLELGPLPSDFEIWESPGPDFVNTIITLVRDGLPALKTLRLAVSLHFRAGWRWPCPLYSWPGTLDEVVLYLWKGDLDHSEIPYLELARSLAALCKRPEGCRLVQLADPEETGYGSEWDHWEDGAVPEVGITKAFGELMEWLLSLTENQQQQIRQIDTAQHGIFPLPPGLDLTVLRRIKLVENDQVVPFKHCAFVDQYRQLREDLNSADPVKAGQARWALEQIGSAV